MKALRLELEIPYWCSFGDFSSLNIKLSYPCPPLPTLFGLIQNALGKESLHNINEKKVNNAVKKEYIKDFNSLKFSIIINKSGEVIEDFLNIHKGSREKEKIEDELKKQLNEYLKNHPDNKEIKKYLTKIKSHDFYIYLKNKNNNEEYLEILNNINDKNIIIFIEKYWDAFNNTITEYNINKVWISTQINKQRIINPHFTAYIVSNDENEFSLENLTEILKNPKRPLYLGESDDIVNINNIEIVKINATKSSNISSIIPGIYPNSELIKLPTNLKFDTNKEYYTLCSAPKGEIDKIIECYEYNGENFVFL